MLVVLSLVPLFLGIAIVWLIVAIMKQRGEPSGSWWSPPDIWPPERKASPDRSQGPAVS